MPARAIASRMTIAPRSAAERSLSTPPNDPIGVRQALRMTAVHVRTISRVIIAEMTRFHWPTSKLSSSSQLRSTEILQRLRIGQRFPVLHLAAVNHVAHRQLHDLPALGPRNLRHLHDPRGHVARRRVLADLAPDALAQRVGQLDAVTQPHEQHDPLVVVPAAGRRPGSRPLRRAARPGDRSRPCRSGRRRGSASRRIGRR